MRSGLMNAFIAAVALVAAGCASTPTEPVKAPAAPTPAPAPKAPAPASSPTPVAPAPAAMVDPLNDPNSPLAKRSIYFDFDRFEVKPEFIATLEAHGRYLVANSSRRITIEGNADERGSREYNLALGQKRAEAVKTRLSLLGVAGNRMETISFGEERPRCKQHEESCWWQNRRADIVYR